MSKKFSPISLSSICTKEYKIIGHNKAKRHDRLYYNRKYKKPFISMRDKNGGFIKPVVKRCIGWGVRAGCGNRVKHHHIYCDFCWRLKNNGN